MSRKLVRRIISCGTVMLLLIIMISGCAKGTMLEEKESYNIGVVLKTMDSEHWQGIRSGMEYAAKQHNVKLTLLYPSNEWAEEEQEVMIRDVLDTDIDALVVAPCNSTNTSWFVEIANEKGIELFTSDTRSLDRDITYIGVDNLEVGKLAAQYMDSHVDDDAKVAVITGASKQAYTIDREGAFTKELSSLRNIDDDDITVSRENSGYAEALQETRELISSGIRGVFCTSVVMGLGAVAASAEMGVDICIVTIDTQDDALKAIQTGELDGLIAHSGYEIGQVTIDTVVNSLKTGTKENVYIDCEMLTEGNVDDYINQRSN